MSRVYDNSPLIEALCAFQFDPDQAWDWTVPGLFYARVRDEFPDRAEQQVMQAGFGVGQPLSPPGNVRRMQFLRKDRTALVQVGPNVLTVNQLPPYTSWQQFRAMIFHNLELYVGIAQSRGITNINLRYINRLEIPSLTQDKSIDVGQYMLAFPGVPNSLLQEPMAHFIQRVEIPMQGADASLILQSGSLPPERSGYCQFLLDLEVATAFTDPVSFDRAREWIERAHDQIDKTFEACITDEARQLFGEKNYEQVIP